jgi:hypothetical protein
MLEVLMLQLIFRTLVAIFTPIGNADAEALHRFAPGDVTVDDAYEHVWAARVAAARYGVDETEILAIAWHESRFTDGVVAKEPGGRVSCGALTPYPTKSCTKKTLLAQYLDGTRHWAVDWRLARGVRGEREALLGFAGGYRLIRACRVGPVLRHGTSGDDLCRTPEVFAQIRARIRAVRDIQQPSGG